jgi:hypothetical protein
MLTLKTLALEPMHGSGITVPDITNLLACSVRDILWYKDRVYDFLRPHLSATTGTNTSRRWNVKRIPLLLKED